MAFINQETLQAFIDKLRSEMQDEVVRIDVEMAEPLGKPMSGPCSSTMTRDGKPPPPGLKHFTSKRKLRSTLRKTVYKSKKKKHGERERVRNGESSKIIS